MATLGLVLEKGRQLAAMELYGDWYRDPWGWPEILTVDFVANLDVETDLAIDRRDVPGSLRPFFHRMEVPKSYLGVRPAVVQDPISRLAYNSAVLQGATDLHSQLPGWVYGWRLRDGEISKNKPEWAGYVDSLPATDDSGYGLITDITSFFSSIEIDRLLEIVGAAVGKTVPRDVIQCVLSEHAKMLGRSGLPQRSFASAILANSYLQPIDDALGSAMGSSTEDITNVRRWMDDISAEGSEEALYGLLLQVQDRARQIGLEINSSKTSLAAASETAKDLRSETLKAIEIEFRKMKLSEYSDEEVDVAVNADVLTALEGEILGNPDQFGRPVIRSVLHSLTEYRLFGRSEEWRQVSNRIPHVADNLGRYLRGAMDEDWFSTEISDCVEWFNEYERSLWGRQKWVTSQFALAFDQDVSVRIRAVLESWLTDSMDLQQVAIAAERLSAMDATYARDVMRARADATFDPLLLRVFALGLLQAKADRGTVSAVLNRDSRNRLLSKYLESRGWEAPPVSSDFGGADGDSTDK